MKQNESQTMELVHQPAQPVARTQDVNPFSGVNVQTLLEKAVDSKAAVEVLKELNALDERITARRAEVAYNEAMSAFQSECPTLIKVKDVKDNTGTTAYKYCPLEVIEAQIRPIENKHGFCHTFDTDISNEQGCVISKCIITHRLGHKGMSTIKLPLGGKTRIMSDTQQTAAAITFANRRALCSAYGLVIAGEDLDGMVQKQKPRGPSAMAVEDPEKRALAKELWEILAPVRGAKHNWAEANRWLWTNNILADGLESPHLTKEQFQDAIVKSKIQLGKA